jgi:transcriptional antiterminator NusG
MNKITLFFRESYRELLEKVSWPTWSELQQSTVIVLVATLVITLVVWLMDVIASSILHLIYSFFVDNRVICIVVKILFMTETVNQQEVKTQPEAKPAPETKWYVLRVVSGKERKVKEYLDKEISRGGWGEIVKQVFLPVEKVYKVQNGKKVMRERNYYPGYVMVEVTEGKLGDDLREVIKNTNSVIHFLGKENPIALRKAEVNKMLGKMDEMAESGSMSMSEPFIIGETIKIIEGPFNDFNGIIEEVNDEKKKLKVTVKIFGRSTPVELNYMQVEKIA